MEKKTFLPLSSRNHWFNCHRVFFHMTWTRGVLLFLVDHFFDPTHRGRAIRRKKRPCRQSKNIDGRHAKHGAHNLKIIEAAHRRIMDTMAGHSASDRRRARTHHGENYFVGLIHRRNEISLLILTNPHVSSVLTLYLAYVGECTMKWTKVHRIPDQKVHGIRFHHTVPGDQCDTYALMSAFQCKRLSATKWT